MKFAQLLLSGVVLGCIYGLIAMGFAIIYKATKIVHFAHGAMLPLGAYLVYTFAVRWDQPWVVALLGAGAICAALNVGMQRIFARRMMGRPLFAAIMITFGFEILLRAAMNLVWRGKERPVGDPWGSDTVSMAGITTPVASLWIIGAATVCMLAVFAFFRFSRLGVQMLGTASDQEAALMSGVPVQRTFAVAWAIAGVLAVVAGVAASLFPRTLGPELVALGMRAFPAAILGGLDSVVGAIVGGMLIGVAEVMVAGYLSESALFGANFSAVSGYIIMIIVLMVRPYGLFGRPEVARV